MIKGLCLPIFLLFFFFFSIVFSSVWMGFNIKARVMYRIREVKFHSRKWNDQCIFYEYICVCPSPCVSVWSLFLYCWKYINYLFVYLFNIWSLMDAKITGKFGTLTIREISNNLEVFLTKKPHCLSLGFI